MLSCANNRILHICVVRARTDFLCHCQGVWKPPTFFSPPFVQSTDTETGIQSGVFTGPLTRSVTPEKEIKSVLFYRGASQYNEQQRAKVKVVVGYS